MEGCCGKRLKRKHKHKKRKEKKRKESKHKTKAPLVWKNGLYAFSIHFQTRFFFSFLEIASIFVALFFCFFSFFFLFFFLFIVIIIQDGVWSLGGLYFGEESRLFFYCSPLLDKSSLFFLLLLFPFLSSSKSPPFSFSPSLSFSLGTLIIDLSHLDIWMLLFLRFSFFFFFLFFSFFSSFSLFFLFLLTLPFSFFFFSLPSPFFFFFFLSLFFSLCRSVRK